MVTRRTHRWGAVAAAVTAIIAMWSAARADSPRSLIAKGNRQYGKQAFGEALEFYDRASVKAPQSPIVAFNKGAALYKQGDYEKAREHFKEAASATKSLSFEAKAWYNLGNVEFREGERQEDSDLQKALGSLQESVKNYVTALEKDPELAEAAENLEIARLKIKDLLDKIKNQQQQGGGQNEQQQQQQQQGERQEQQEGENEERQGEEQQQEQQAGQDTEQQEKDQKSSADKEKQKPLESAEAARQILDEEKENRRERQRQEGRSKYRPVGKDW